MKQGGKCRRAGITRLFIAVVIALLAIALVLPIAAANSASAKFMETPTLDREGMFDNPYTSLEEALEAARAKHEEVVDEGTALLKNNGLLPLKATETGSSKVTVFNSAPALVEALEGVGFEVNDVSPQTDTDLGHEGSDNKGVITELTADQLKSVDKYNDVAVVRIFRTAGEANDVSTGSSLTPGSKGGIENFGDITWVNDEGDIVEWTQEAFEAGTIHEAWPDGTPKGWNHEHLAPDDPKATYTDIANPDKRVTSPVRHGLMMTVNEEKMIQLVKQHFDNIVVVYDSITQFELWDLEHDDDIDAIIHSGRMTNTSLNNPSLWAGRGVARVMAGEVNPSAHLVSQWDRDMTADPTWQNFGDNFQMDSSTTYMYSDGTSTGSQTRGSIGGGSGLHGVDYEEGIYLGYKYYETYWYETAQGNTAESDGTGEWSEKNQAAADAWHDAHVTYPFGYGLSYTDFDYEIVGVSRAGGEALTAGGTVQGEEFASTAEQAAKVKTLNVTVKITNTGNRAGKAVGQIYVSAPYIDGGVEVPYVKLVGFDKTRSLEPGQSDTFVVPVEMQDIASFDYDGKAGIKVGEEKYTGYVLNEGEYTLRLMNSSSQLRAERAGQYDEFSFTIANGGSNVALTQDDFSGNEISAIFSTPNTREYTIRDGNIMADGESGMTIMSRGDLDGTFPEAPTIDDLKLDDNYIDDYVRSELGFVAGYTRARSESGLTTPSTEYTEPKLNGTNAWYYDAEKGDYDYRDDESDPWFISKTEFDAVAKDWTQASQSVRDNDKTGAGAVTKLREMAGVALFEEDGSINPEWDAFMNQMTYLELQILASCGNSALARIDAIDKNQSAARDNTSVLSNIYHWGDQPLLSRTWNLDLCADHGEITAHYAAFGNNSPTGWWSPGCNLQRTPFSGRNGDYYGQDAFQAGMIISAVVGAAEENGLACWIKHFVLNDQETNRNGYSLFTWGDEQTFRENYFMYPQKAMQEGGAKGYMQSFARIGGVVFAYSYEANTVLTREQWGWTGIGVTDMLAGHSGPGYAVPETAGNLFEAEALGKDTTGAFNKPDQTKDWGIDGGDGRMSSLKPVTLDQLVRGTHGLPDGTQSRSSKFENGAYVNTINCYDAATKTVKIKTGFADVGNNPVSGIWSDKLNGVYLETEEGASELTEMTDSGRNQWYHVRLTAMLACYESANSRGNQNGMLVNDNTNQLRNYHGTTADISGLTQGTAMTAKSVAIEDETYENSVVYSVVEGALPAGLTLDSATGEISGTPTVSTSAPVEVVIECRVANYLYGNKTVTIAPIASVITLSDNVATAGKSFSADLECELDDATFEIVGALPEGLTLEDGTISGTPVYTGKFDFTVNATVGRTVYSTDMSISVVAEAGLTEDEVKALIAGSASGGLTEDQVDALIEAAIADFVTEDQVEALIAAAGSGLTEAEVDALIEEATSGFLTESEVDALIDAALAEGGNGGGENGGEDGGCGSAVSLSVIAILLLAALLPVGVVLAVKAKKQH